MNTSQRIAAQRYAAAYDALSTTAQDALRRQKDLHNAIKALAPAQRFMTSPRVSTASKKALVLSALSSLPDTASFIALLVEAKRYALLAEIEQQVQSFTDARLGIVRAEVESAQALTPAQQKQTVEAIGERYNAKAEVIFKVSPQLLGGLKISCNGEQIDGSLQGKLERMLKEISK